MKLTKEGYIPIIKKLKSLQKGWDGYSAKPIKKPVLKKFSDMSYLHELIKLFRNAGFKETDIEVIPGASGIIQLEAELDDRYFEIEIK